MTLRLATMEAFRACYRYAHDTHPHASALTHPSELELAGATLVLSDDGASGYAITASGDLRYVFSRARGRGDALVTDAIRRGARTLDCFDGYLPALYARHGFVVVRRAPNWTAGGPDVVYMAYNT